MHIFATILAKVCCFVGQIVVGAIIGLIYVHVAWRFIGWVDEKYWTYKNNWKSRKSGDAVLAK